MADQSGLSPAYPIEFLFRSAPRIGLESLAKALSARLGPVRRAAETRAGAVQFMPHDPVYARTGNEKPALELSGSEHSDHSRLQGALSQSFDVENGATRLEACRASVVMTAIAAPGTAERDHRVMIAAGLMAVLDCLEAELIFWPMSGQVLDPEKVRAKLSEPVQRANPTYGFVNVRLFNVEDGGTHIMDTLGLAALGLPDLQVHFRGLEKAEVADLLYSVAAYLMENGNVIDNGHTVPGLLPGESWTCTHAMALVGPDRLVLDIDPGAAFSAGGAG